MSKNIQITFRKLHQKQDEIRKNAKRFNVCNMGRRFGKTVLGLDILGYDHLGFGHSCAWFAPSYKYLDEVWRDSCSLFRPIITRTDKQQMRIELLTGGVLDFWTLDSEDVARGRKYHCAVIDEAAIVRDLQTRWEQAIRPTLTDYEGSAWFMSTPKGKTFFHTLYNRANLPEYCNSWASFHAPTSSNPHIKASEIEQARMELPQLVFAQEYLAEFVDFGGSMVKPEWIREGVEPAGSRNVMAVDLAIGQKQINDKTAIVVMTQDAEGRIYIVHATQFQAPFHSVLKQIKEVYDRFQCKVCVIEQVQYQAAVVQELNRTTHMNVHGVHPDKDKMTRFQPMVARYEQQLVYHSPNLPHWFKDEICSFPLGAHDDVVDATSYAFLALKYIQSSSQYSAVNNKPLWMNF